MRALRRVLILLVVVAAAAPARAVSPEEELGPELMALADVIVDKVIYGIRYESLPANRIQAVVRAWADHYVKEGVIDTRQSAIIQIYATRAARRYRLGVEHVPYGERKAGEGAR